MDYATINLTPKVFLKIKYIIQNEGNSANQCVKNSKILKIYSNLMPLTTFLHKLFF